ncbi:hypothetical protein EV144_103399 [Flavobacterium sp. 270]|nr:hypothetical protein EV144_103399 [Flavobacterium sp. 270]
MNKFKLFLKHNFINILKIEFYLFFMFILLTILFHFDNNAHQYFNNTDFPLNLNGIFALIITLFFGLFFFICLIFPFLLLLKLIFILNLKMINKKNILLLVGVALLYAGTLLSVFSLYSIKQNLNIVDKKQIK